jgi:ComF family protein
LYKQEQHLCLTCWYTLPKINLHQLDQSPVLKVFEGRVPVKAAIAYLYFYRNGSAQTIMHAIKYQGQKDLAFSMGAHFAKDHLKHIQSLGIQAFIPVPLYYKKQKSRGYNQSELIAQGLSSVTGVPVLLDVLKLLKPKETQTHKSRFDRWLNAEKAYVFEASNWPNSITCVALIDDVVTTGATIEACVSAIRTVVSPQIVVLSVCFPLN